MILVDDGSPTPLAPLAERYPFVTVIRQKNAGPAAARNAGVAAAGDAEVILFTDDDCRPKPDWADRLLAAQEGDPDRLVGGRVVNGLDENAYSRASQAILTYSYGAFDDFSDRLSFFTTNNMAVSTERFRALGGFDTRYRFASEDRDFSFRWRLAGGHLVHTAEAEVTHLHRLTARGFLRQQFSYGRGARRFHRRVAGLDAPDVAMGSARFYAGLLLHPLARPSGRAAVTTILIGVAHAVLAAGYATEAWQARKPDRQETPTAR